MKETVYKIPGAPHLALLSDLHNRPYASITASLRRNRPDLICITGDIVYGSWPEDKPVFDVQKNVLPFLSACANIAPTFLSLGNHERELTESDLEEIAFTGVVVLDNSWEEKDGLIIGGLTSGSVMEFRRTPHGADSMKNNKPDTAWLNSFASVPGYHVLLSHHPEYISLIPAAVDLVLAGHAHGGQWRLFGHGLFAPGQGWWPQYTKGVYDGRLVVSAGLSNTAHVPRIMNPTEIVYVKPSSR